MVVAGAVAGALFANAAFAQTRELVINYDDLNPAPKTSFEAVVDKFRAANPDINVITNIQDREAYKTAIRNFLTADAPDVAAWYAGNRMAPFVKAGLFADVSDVWADNGFDKTLASTMPSMTIDGKQYGVPYTYYQWGIYYRPDVFAKVGLEPPTTFDELIAACETLNANDIAPFTIGTKFLWPAAGVFDYLNLRTNGFDIHNQLTAGEIKYTDPRIVAVFDNWKRMLDAQCFIDNHASMSWQEALAPFINGEAAMYVMGNFSVAAMRDGGLSDEQIDYIPFPTINPDVARAEEAPTDTFHIPTNADNKEDAKKFLAFIAQPDIQTEWNAALGQLPINSEASVGDDKFLQKGFETLNGAAGIAQFYDRDAPAEMAKAGMEGFQEFMIKPDRQDRILDRLDRIQQRVYR
ncbi:MAG: extracellular solute-binding protein [Pseudomonadota bacterium]